MSAYLNVAQIIISIVLMVVILLQTKGASSFGGSFSNDASVFRTRRGLEKTLFQLAIGLSIVFIVVSIASVMVAGS